MSKTALEKLAVSTVRAFERNEHRPNVHFELTRCEIVDENSSRLNWDVFGALLSAPVNLTITGASTVKLVCEDPDAELLNDPVFAKWMFRKTGVSKSSTKAYAGRKITDSNKTARYGEETEEKWILPEHPIDLNLDGIWFRLAGFQLQETTLTLTFEDRVAAVLRGVPGFTTVNRGDFTRAQFIDKQLNEAERANPSYGKIKRFIPELKIPQEVAAPTASESAIDLKSSAARVLTVHDGITVKGLPATDAQLKIINAGLEVAVTLKAPFKSQVALLVAYITENMVANPNPGTAADEGVLSLLASTAASFHVNPYDIVAVTTQFLAGPAFTGGPGAIALARSNPHLTAVGIAGIVQGGEYQNSGKFLPEAEHMVRVYGATEASEGGSASTVPGPYAFTRGPNETYWDSFMRLASEVSWYCFVRENTLWYVSGNFLFAQESRMKIVRGENGIDWVEPNIDVGARDGVAEIVVKGRASLWTAVSGNAVQVGRVGPANGKWVVDTVSLDVEDRADAVTIVLQKPLPARPEPSTGSSPAGVGELEGGAGRGAGTKTALAAYYAASALSELQLPYLWGGGHASGALATVKKGSAGLDCSGSTSWILHESGMWPSTTGTDSTGLESWGAAGQGKEMTVWANANHVFIEFNVPGHGKAQANTNGPQNGSRLYTMPGTYNPNPSQEGYVPRHWPGT